MAVERAVDSSQLLANCVVWMGTLSVCPSTRSGPAGRVVARMEIMGIDAGRTSAEPEGKKPASWSEMTRPSGVMRIAMPPGGMPPAATCWAMSLRRRASVSSKVSLLAEESGRTIGEGTELVMAEALMSVSGGVFEWASKVPRGVNAVCIASESLSCFFLSDWLEANILEGLAVFAVPRSHRRRLRTSNMLERLNEELKRRTRVAGLFPNDASLLRLVTAVLMEVSEDWETNRKYLTMGPA